MKPSTRNPIFRLSSLSLTALMLASCGDGFRNGYRPGDIETLGNATVYHLADGVFIQERFEGSPHYYLVETTVADYRLKPEGLEVDFRGAGGGIAVAGRQTDHYVAAFMTRVPGDGPEATRFQIDASTLERIVDEFDADMTVADIYRRKK